MNNFQTIHSFKIIRNDPEMMGKMYYIWYIDLNA